MNPRTLEEMENIKDFYQLLGVKKTSTTAEINKAWKQTMLLYHPDKNSAASPEILNRLTKLAKVINDARDTLIDPDKRAAYDRSQQSSNTHHQEAQRSAESERQAQARRAENERQARERQEAEEAKRMEKLAEENKLCGQVADLMETKIMSMPNTYKKLNGVLSKNKHIVEINRLVNYVKQYKNDQTPSQFLAAVLNGMNQIYGDLYQKINEKHNKRKAGFFQKFSPLISEPNKHHFIRMLGLTMQEAVTTLQDKGMGYWVDEHIKNLHLTIKDNHVTKPYNNAVYDKFVALGNDINEKEKTFKHESPKFK